MRALSMSELNRLLSEAIEIENPESEPLFKSRLLWMLDHQPTLTRDLYRRRELKLALGRNLQAATLSLVQMTAKGYDAREARDLVLETVVALSETRPTSSPTPLPEEEQEEILQALLN